MTGAYGWGAWIALARVEWRQFRMHPRRTLLLVALVAVPVAAMVGGATLLRIVEPTAEESRAAQMGAAAMRVDLPEGRGYFDRARALLPAKARVEQVARGVERVLVPGVRLRARLLALEPGALAPAGLARGLVRLDRGRPPADSSEVALSPVLMQGLARALGDTVALGDGAPRVVTGVAFDPEALDDPLVVRTPARAEGRADHSLLVDLPGGSVAPTAAALRAAGYPVHERKDTNGRDGTGTALVFLFGSVGFLQAALVIAAAFAVSLRRRQRDIGLLGSLGATRRGIVSGMVASATVLGAFAAACGVALGAAGALALLPFLDRLNRRWNGGFELPLEYALLAALLGVVAAAAAVAFPARLAARLPIREALGARRPVRAISRRGWIAGLAMEALAIALLWVPSGHGLLSGTAVLGGAVLGVVGFGVCSPGLLAALAGHASSLPLAWRLAVRDSGRFAARNGPVVTAILSAMAMGVLVAVLVASIDAKLRSFPAPCRDDQLVLQGSAAEEVARRLAAGPRAIGVAPLLAVYADGVPLVVRVAGDSAGTRRASWVACGGDTLLRVLDAAAGARALQGGALVALGLARDAGSPRVFEGPHGRERTWNETRRVAVSQNVAGPAYVVALESLAQRGLVAGPPPGMALTPWIVRLDRAVSDDALRAAQALAAAAPGTQVDAARLHRGPARAFFYTLLLVCILTGLLVVWVATALTAAESADDEHVLHTVGAAPALLRGATAARAGYLAFLGCVLAVPAGMLPAIGLLQSAHLTMEIVVPWRDVVLTVFALPVLAYALIYAGAKKASPARLPAAAPAPFSGAASAAGS